VELLPDILLRVYGDKVLRGLDLFCIPKDRTPLAIIEISCQVSIFGTAAQAVCWLNSISDWQ